MAITHDLAYKQTDPYCSGKSFARLLSPAWAGTSYLCFSPSGNRPQDGLFLLTLFFSFEANARRAPLPKGTPISRHCQQDASPQEPLNHVLLHSTRNAPRFGVKQDHLVQTLYLGVRFWNYLGDPKRVQTNGHFMFREHVGRCSPVNVALVCPGVSGRRARSMRPLRQPSMGGKMVPGGSKRNIYIYISI